MALLAICRSTSSSTARAPRTRPQTIVMAAKEAPVGTWETPITSELITSQSIRLGAPVVSGDGSVYWLEGRPTEGGRQVLVRRYYSWDVDMLLPTFLLLSERGTAFSTCKPALQSPEGCAGHAIICLYNSRLIHGWPASKQDLLSATARSSALLSEHPSSCEVVLGSSLRHQCCHA